MSGLSRRQMYLFWGAVAGGIGVIVWFMVGAIAYGDLRYILGDAALLALFVWAAFLYLKKTLAVNALRAGELRYRLLMEGASDAISVTDADGRYLDVNDSACALTGYSRDELLGMSVADLIPLDEIERMRRNLERLAEGEPVSMERKIRRKDGSVITVDLRANRLADGRNQAMMRDITDQRAMEEALRRREELFRAISELTSDYVYSMRVNPDGTLDPEWFTDAFERVTGYTVEEAHARGGWTQIVPKEDLPELAENFQKMLLDRNASESDFRIIAKSGEIKFLRSWVKPVWSEEEGRVFRIYGAVSDMTEATLLERSLRESEERYRNLYERLPIGIYLRSWEGGVGIDANPAAVEMFRYPDKDSFLAAPSTAFYVRPEDHQRWRDTLEQQEVVSNFVVETRRYDGTTMWVRNSGRVVKNEAGEISFYEGAIQDVTQQKHFEEELQRALAAVQKTDDERRRLLTHLVKAKEDERNRVASDIHDDSVQVMTSAAISLERVARQISDTTARAELAQVEDAVRAAIGRLRTMVFELRPPTLDEDGLSSALRLYLEEFRLEAGIDFTFKNELDEEPSAPLRVVLYRIAQEALINVRKHAAAHRVEVLLRREGHEVVLEVRDDGMGFCPEALAERVPGHIGLAEMRERAEMGGGRLEVHSELEVGTTVRARVPSLTEQVAS
ncbi:MAG: PAS domain S-box protein [Actinomycetota bacterium]